MRVSANLERLAGSFPDLVQLVLQGVDLPLHLFEGGAFRSDEQASILAPGVAQEGSLDGGRVVWSSRRLCCTDRLVDVLSPSQAFA
jgi:hypothetical protein